MEKIDKVRESAGRTLQHFFKFNASKVADFAEKDKLYALFGIDSYQDEDQDILMHKA